MNLEDKLEQLGRNEEFEKGQERIRKETFDSWLVLVFSLMAIFIVPIGIGRALELTGVIHFGDSPKVEECQK